MHERYYLEKNNVLRGEFLFLFICNTLLLSWLTLRKLLLGNETFCTGRIQQLPKLTNAFKNVQKLWPDKWLYPGLSPGDEWKKKTNLQKSTGSTKNIYVCRVRRCSLTSSKHVAVLRHSPSPCTSQGLLCLHVCWCFTRSLLIKCT
jgi:hypothetical protein